MIQIKSIDDNGWIAQSQMCFNLDSTRVNVNVNKLH